MSVDDDLSMQGIWTKRLIRGIYKRKGQIDKIENTEEISQDKSDEISITSNDKPHYYREFKMSSIVENIGPSKNRGKSPFKNAKKSMFGGSILEQEVNLDSRNLDQSTELDKK